MLIDTHAHLNFKAFDKDLSLVLKNAASAGVKKIIIPGAQISSSKKGVEIASDNSSCFAAVGIHPHHTQEYILLGTDKVKSELEKLINAQKVVAIGEAGLDYHVYQGYPAPDKVIKNQQKELLLLQVNLAITNKLPVIFHCRDAYDDLLEILTSIVRSSNISIKGVIHCFEGDRKHLIKFLDLGLYIGFDGNITYPENDRNRNLVKYTPPDKLLLETDSPYLTPLPFRGGRNSPANLSLVASEIGRIKNKCDADIASITTRSAVQLFNL